MFSFEFREEFHGVGGVVHELVLVGSQKYDCCSRTDICQVFLDVQLLEVVRGCLNDIRS